MTTPKNNFADFALLAAAGKTFQKIAVTISESFTRAQIDPSKAAEIKELAKRLKLLKDLPND